MKIKITFPFYRKLVTKDKISYYKILWFNIYVGFRIEYYSFTKDKVTKGSFNSPEIRNWESISKKEFDMIAEHYSAIHSSYQKTMKQFAQGVFDLNS